MNPKVENCILVRFFLRWWATVLVQQSMILCDDVNFVDHGPFLFMVFV